MGYGDAAWQKAFQEPEDHYGLDRQARALLRVLSNMARGTLVAVHGAPGSGKSEFLRRLAWLAAEEGHSLVGAGEAAMPFVPHVVWYNPWTYAKQGHVLCGLLAHVATVVPRPGPMLLDRARDVATYLSKMHFGAAMAPGFGSLLQQGDVDPIDRVQSSFKQLVDLVKQGQPGRVLVVVDGLDDLAPALRFTFIDGVRLLLQSGADVTLVAGIGREAALDAIRHREGPIPEASAGRYLDELVDLTITVPSLEIRRIPQLLRAALGEGERALTRSFGANAVNQLCNAVSYRPLGAPRFLQRLAARVVLLAEFLQEVRATRELNEAQWAWVVIGERWPEFRRHLIRGGRERWIELHAAVSFLVASSESRADAPVEAAGVLDWLHHDPLLAEYLLQHASSFQRDMEAVYWMENLLLSAGL